MLLHLIAYLPLVRLGLTHRPRNLSRSDSVNRIPLHWVLVENSALRGSFFPGLRIKSSPAIVLSTIRETRPGLIAVFRSRRRFISAPQPLHWQAARNRFCSRSCPRRKAGESPGFPRPIYKTRLPRLRPLQPALQCGSHFRAAMR